MLMQKIKQIFGILFMNNGSDETTALGILKSLNNKCTIQLVQNRLSTDYQVVIDNFNILITKQLDMSQNPMGGIGGSLKYKLFGQQYYYTLLVDDVIFDVSQRTISKMFNKIIDILDQPNKEREDYIKKDAKIHFN